MNIEIGKGLSYIKFGMSEQQIINIWGIPDKSYMDEYGSKYLQYFDKQVVLKIDSDINNCLGWIEVYNDQTTLLNQNLFKMAKQNILNYLTDKLREEPEFEDYGSLESYTYQKHWLELQFELGRLHNINFGYLFDKNGEPILSPK